MKALCLCLILFLMFNANADEVPGYVRLHIVAESDGAEDQVKKLLARDAVLAEAREILFDCRDPDEAWERLKENLDAMEKAAESASGQSVIGEMGVFPFPERDYGNLTLPAGEYRALRLTLGRGEGCNWWCVLYPGLCMPEDISREPMWKTVFVHWLLWREKGV